MERGNARLKFFDRYLGPILLLMIAPIRFFRPSRVPDKIQSIAILKTAAIGDTVLVSAIVDDLRAACIRVVLFVGSSNAGFATRLAGVEVRRLPLTSPLKCVQIIRQEKFDVFLDLDPWPRISALLTAFSKAKLRLGFKTRGQHRHYAYDQVGEHRGDRHELENYRVLLKSLKIAASSFPQTFGRPWKGTGPIVFHMWPSGTQSHLKEWAPENWRWLASQLGRTVILTGGPDDAVRTADFVNQSPSGVFSSSAGSSFDETLRVLQSASLLVSVNTGIMHVGAAMGVPTVGLHGPTNPVRWGPIGPRVRVVASRMEGAGQLNLGFEYLNDTNYMNGIDRNEVLDACLALLGESEDDSSRVQS